MARPRTDQWRCDDHTIFREDFIANTQGKAIDFDFCCSSNSEFLHYWQQAPDYFWRRFVWRTRAATDRTIEPEHRRWQARASKYAVELQPDMAVGTAQL
jgi:hypothetical protein